MSCVTEGRLPRRAQGPNSPYRSSASLISEPSSLELPRSSAPGSTGSELHRVLLIAPGSGACGRALKAASDNFALHIAVDPKYDVHGRRYPPGWLHMHDVKLHEEEAAASGIDVMQLGRGRASPQNLATWAGKLFDPETRTLSCIDLSLLNGHATHRKHTGGATAPNSGGAGAANPNGASPPEGGAVHSCAGAAAPPDGSAEPLKSAVPALVNGVSICGEETAAADDPLYGLDAAEMLVRPAPEVSLACLVCGSRGGQVTVPALWRLGAPNARSQTLGPLAGPPAPTLWYAPVPPQAASCQQWWSTGAAAAPR